MQHFYDFPEIRVIDGKATFAKRHLSVYADGTRARKGQTRKFNDKCLLQFYQQLYYTNHYHFYF